MDGLGVNIAASVIFETSKLALRGATPLLSVVQDLASPRDALFADSLYDKFVLFIGRSGIRDGRLRNGYEVKTDMERLLTRIASICANISAILAQYAPDAVGLETSEESLRQRAAAPANRNLADGQDILGILCDRTSWARVAVAADTSLRAARFRLSGDSANLKNSLHDLDDMLNKLLWTDPTVTECYMIERHRNACLDRLGVEGLRQLMSHADEEFGRIAGRRCIKHLSYGADGNSIPRNITGTSLPRSYMELSEADANSILMHWEPTQIRWLSSVKDLPQIDDLLLDPGHRSSYYVKQVKPLTVLVEAAIWPDSTLFWERLAVLCYAHSGAFHTAADQLPIVVGRHRWTLSSGGRGSLVLYRVPSLAPKSVNGPVTFDTLRQLFLNTSVRPDMDARVNLARSLFMFVYRYHQMEWLHKQLRPEHILLFRYQRDRPGDDLSHVLITGLTYTRQSSKLGASYSERATTGNDSDAPYKHPRYTAKIEFCEEFDLFALGVLLSEIFLWEAPRNYVKYVGLAEEMRNQKRMAVFREISWQKGRSIASVITGCIWGVFQNPRTSDTTRIDEGIRGFEMCILSEMERISRGYNS